MLTAQEHSIVLKGRHIKYRVVRSRTGHKLRVRVGPHGIEVFQPAGRVHSEVGSFLLDQASWVLDQIRRVEQFQAIRRPEVRRSGEILFRGVPTPICVEGVHTRVHGNKVQMHDGAIVVQQGMRSTTPLARSLKRWLRKQARHAIETQLSVVTPRLGQKPAGIYIMDQRTKWGNCSSKKILSFNWRLILAPDFVLRYLVTHEAVHLAVPDHSAKFWLTVQSFCPETEKAKQWLCANGYKLTRAPEIN
jgi:predicted metal-dependent hydrolase